MAKNYFGYRKFTFSLKSKSIGKGRVCLQKKILKLLLRFEKFAFTNLTREKSHFKFTFAKIKFTVTRLPSCQESTAMMDGNNTLVTIAKKKKRKKEEKRKTSS